MVEPQQQKVLKILHKENEIQTRKGGEYQERAVLGDFNTIVGGFVGGCLQASTLVDQYITSILLFLIKLIGHPPTNPPTMVLKSPNTALS